jgi:hypothetical protein
MKVTSPPKAISSVHFRERARHYWLAAAIADAPAEVGMFRDLAMMFEKLAEDFARAETGARIALSAFDSVERAERM